jgi:hypothetical protein
LNTNLKKILSNNYKLTVSSFVKLLINVQIDKNE